MLDADDVSVVVVVCAAGGADEVRGGVRGVRVASAALYGGECVGWVRAGAEGGEGRGAGEPGFGAGVHEVGLVGGGCEG